ncbi:hypothetical protein [Streptomyces sp. MP131-18]|uniref:hypothetical protein n=1 Tax=Streptomyces sp. MP131-18 TaxID=1857892 RepID=UPI00097C1EA2|nr:hypothetical protein [Streptomyces sp. MP131-18]ONK10063.1 hypothetical protein STBA_07700 [Streptomyces sp. MP131-18]
MKRVHLKRGSAGDGVLLVLPGLAVSVMVARLPRRSARAVLRELLGRCDAAWFEFYQGALCHLDGHLEPAGKMRGTRRYPTEAELFQSMFGPDERPSHGTGGDANGSCAPDPS